MLYSIWHTVAEAFLAGMTLSFMFGPAFFTLLQTSLEKGFRSAFWIACGIFLCDSLLVLISFLGASRLFTDPSTSKVIGIAGGIILVLIGIHTFQKKVVINTKVEKTDNTPSSPGMSFLKGFLMNLANPGTWIFWFVTVGAITAQYTTDNGEVVGFRVFVFFLITLCTIFSMDVLKSFVANKIKRVVNERTIGVVNKVVGVVLVLFGLYLFLSSFIPLNIDSVTGALRLN